MLLRENVAIVSSSKEQTHFFLSHFRSVRKFLDQSKIYLRASEIKAHAHILVTFVLNRLKHIILSRII